jgi:hypothetical protein
MQTDDNDGTFLKTDMVQGDDFEDDPSYDGSGQRQPAEGSSTAALQSDLEEEFKLELMRGSHLSEDLRGKMEATKSSLRQIVAADK